MNVNTSGHYPFDNYDNIREDLISLGYNRGYINNMPLWKLRDLYNIETSETVITSLDRGFNERFCSYFGKDGKEPIVNS